MRVFYFCDKPLISCMGNCAFPLYMRTSDVLFCTGAEEEEAVVGRFCSGRQTEDIILVYLFVAESVVIIGNAVTSWKNKELSGQGMIGHAL